MHSVELSCNYRRWHAPRLIKSLQQKVKDMHQMQLFFRRVKIIACIICFDTTADEHNFLRRLDLSAWVDWNGSGSRRGMNGYYLRFRCNFGSCKPAQPGPGWTWPTAGTAECHNLIRICLQQLSSFLNLELGTLFSPMPCRVRKKMNHACVHGTLCVSNEESRWHCLFVLFSNLHLSVPTLYK